MPAKRHHYVPQMLLRRFTIDLSRSNSSVYRLDKAAANIHQLAIANASVVGGYNTLSADNERNPTVVEEWFSQVEGNAVNSISQIVSGKALDDDDWEALSLFVWIQHMRTPLGRTRMKEVLMVAKREKLLRQAQDPIEFHKNIVNSGLSLESDELETLRLERIEALRGDEFEVSVDSDDEIKGQLFQASEGAANIRTMLSWTGLRTQGSARFVLSDHPVTFVDLTAPLDEPVAWLSSPSAEVTVPLDPEFCLLLRPTTEDYGELTIPDEIVLQP